MKAIVLEKAGGVENLLYKNVNQPQIKENEVLIAVKAIGVNPVDYKVRRNDQVLSAIYGEDRPAILGWDIAGTVTSVGSEVRDFKIGGRSVWYGQLCW